MIVLCESMEGLERRDTDTVYIKSFLGSTIWFTFILPHNNITVEFCIMSLALNKYFIY